MPGAGGLKPFDEGLDVAGVAPDEFMVVVWGGSHHNVLH